MTDIVRQWSWPGSVYDGTLPPPLCFTEPAQLPRTRGQLHVGPTPAVAFPQPHLMMDPSEPATWQRPYVFT